MSASKGRGYLAISTLAWVHVVRVHVVLPSFGDLIFE